MIFWHSTFTVRLPLRVWRADSRVRDGKVTGWLRAVNRFALTLTIWTYSQKAWHGGTPRRGGG